MTSEHAYWRELSKATICEDAGKFGEAVAHLDRAARLTSDVVALEQIAA